ncbi:hypothetical protein CPLU01_03021 [Colletotrichum plurivorum]|uniref:Uncharacterized protein n=1 Tax=Colletotrichum plurivorum TaxID=2175906 RepID=A0A8H6KTH1_9PEZI|nr:hypothetical protein CPLU01_03021 [Colletotrichum plurivorum]
MPSTERIILKPIQTCPILFLSSESTESNCVTFFLPKIALAPEAQQAIEECRAQRQAERDAAPIEALSIKMDQQCRLRGPQSLRRRSVRKCHIGFSASTISDYTRRGVGEVIVVAPPIIRDSPITVSNSHKQHDQLNPSFSDPSLCTSPEVRLNTPNPGPDIVSLRRLGLGQATCSTRYSRARAMIATPGGSLRMLC